MPVAGLMTVSSAACFPGLFEIGGDLFYLTLEDTRFDAIIDLLLIEAGL